MDRDKMGSHGMECMVDSIIMDQKSDFKEELEHLQGHLPD
jgi:hypothetical protein